MPWQQSALLAVALVVVAGLARHYGGRRGRRLAPWLWQSAVVLALYTLWQIALDALVTSTAGAVEHGGGLDHAERWLHFPTEAAFQALLLPHPLVVQAANAYYADVDFPVLGACLA